MIRFLVSCVSPNILRRIPAGTLLRNRNYRDRQYGYESSSFNRQAVKPPIALIITDGFGDYRATTLEVALPNAFSTANFMPKAVKEFLRTHESAK
jgi:hypothetical protein